MKKLVADKYVLYLSPNTVLDILGINRPHIYPSVAIAASNITLSSEFISTGVRALDDLLEGGVEVGSITEFIGEFGAGKTQICHQLAVMVQFPRDEGGLDARALYIDAEGTFRPERIIQIARYRGQDPEKTLENIIYARAYNSDHLLMILKSIANLIKDANIKLIILDGFTTLPRREYGQDIRQARNYIWNIGYNLWELQRMSVAIVLSNQVIYYSGRIRPAGGRVADGFATHRVFIEKMGEGLRKASIICSPNLGKNEALFHIFEGGVIDV